MTCAECGHAYHVGPCSAPSIASAGGCDCEYPTEYVSRCPACGDVIDYCQGHGEIGDPAGYAILEAHDAGDHTECHPAGCDDAAAAELEPTCDLCGEPQDCDAPDCHICARDWNGATGQHRSCESAQLYQDRRQPAAIEYSPTYRRDMRDAGRGGQLP